jgi:hypothetical protein
VRLEGREHLELRFTQIEEGRESLETVKRKKTHRSP